MKGQSLALIPEEHKPSLIEDAHAFLKAKEDRENAGRIDVYGPNTDNAGLVTETRKKVGSRIHHVRHDLADK